MRPATRGLSGRLAFANKLWPYAPLPFAAAYLITLATQFSSLLASSYLNADAASAPVIGELFGARDSDATVILGHLGWYSTLLFELATKWLPLHRQIWEAAPYAMALGAATLIGWGAWRVAGRWAGTIAAAIVICAGPGTLSLLFALNDHGSTWFTLTVLGAFVVLLEEQAKELSRVWLVVLTLIVGVILGANAASDVLLAIAGGVPLALAVGCAWLLRPSRRTATAAVFAGASIVIAVASAVLVRAYMTHHGVVSATDANTKVFAGPEAVGTNFKLWWQSIAVLGNGNFFGQAVGFSAGIAFLCAAMTIAAVLVTARAARIELAAALSAGRKSNQGREQDALLAWWAFWGSSMVLLSASFIFSGSPEDLGSSRYLVGVIYAVAALVPLVSKRGALTRLAVTAGVTVYAFAGWLALTQHKIVPPASPNEQLAGAVERFAEEEHLAVGYAGYWDAAPITWETHLRTKVFPVDDCDGNQHLCAFELHIITSWYSPRTTAKSFLLSDATYPSVPSAPTPDLGKPIAVHQIGAVTMFVYPYDIAARLFAL